MLKCTENEAMCELINHLTVINSQHERQIFIKELCSTKSPKTVAFLNTRALQYYICNEEFRKAILNVDYLLLDGIGISMLATSLKFHMGINMNGTDLIPEILSSPKIKTFAIFGATDEVIVLAKEKLETMAKNVVAYCDGYHDNSTYSRKLRYLELDVVLLSMGMPKQELISNIISKDKKINNRLIICAGGFLDFFSRVKPRAPKFIITYRLEWLFRLIKEPARMFERNLYNIKIILIIGLNTLKGNA